MNRNQSISDDRSNESGEDSDEDEWKTLSTKANVYRISALPDKIDVGTKDGFIYSEKWFTEAANDAVMAKEVEEPVRSLRKFKSMIDNQTAKVKSSKARFQNAKQKEKKLKLKMQDEVGKSDDGVDLLKYEHETVVSEIKNEMAEAHFEVLEPESMTTNEKQRYQAAKTETLISDIDGNGYLKLKGYADDSNIFLRDVGTRDGSMYREKRLTIDAEQAKEVEECVCALRERKVIPQRLKDTYVRKPDGIL